MKTKEIIALYGVGVALFVVSALLPCTSDANGLGAALWALMFFFLYPFHAVALIAVLVSPFWLFRIRKGELRWFWIVLPVCLPAIWLSPMTSRFPSVQIGYFVWAISISLIALSLGLWKHEQVLRNEPTADGYPPEAFADGVVFWAYVMAKRQEHAAMLIRGQNSTNSELNFFRHVYVDRKYITDPLSDEDIKAANAWKAAYLRRLRQEKTDESYINAYLQAWNLSSNAVSGAVQ